MLQANARSPEFSIMKKFLILIATAVPLLHTFGPRAMGQGSGTLKGTVRVASGAPVPGVAVVATNQVTGKWKRARSGADGVYSFRLSVGAYRLKVSAPHLAKFDRDKNYGEFAIPRGEVLENVIVASG